MTNNIYLTTTIPFVNAPPHIGFALELVQADALARYHRLRGATVRLQTGTDENAFKNVLSARLLGVPVTELVDRNAARFRDLCQVLNVSPHGFVRTTTPGHRRAVHAFIERLAKDDVYRAAYRGLYCPGCEDFYLERDLDADRCPEHGTPVVPVEERNVFFRLGAYQDDVRTLIASGRLRVVPPSREAEVLRFIDRGLTDISLSRDAARSGGWGIPYPGEPDQVVYVWIDALINYLSGLGFPDASDVSRFWSAGSRKVHLAGKNVWKFHAIYWPALLLSAGLPVPDTIVVHGFLTNEGKKISKSSGNGIDPASYVDQFGVDAVRWLLLRHIHPIDDSDFSVGRLAEAYTIDLANGIGNLCSRLTTLAESAELPGVSVQHAPAAPTGFHNQVAAYRPDLATALLWEEIRAINRALVDAKPWDLLRDGQRALACQRLSAFVERLVSVAFWLEPFLPNTSLTIRQALAQPRIRKLPPLFPPREITSLSHTTRT
jgi:methionyl-tRNA synthetase